MRRLEPSGIALLGPLGNDSVHEPPARPYIPERTLGAHGRRADGDEPPPAILLFSGMAVGAGSLFLLLLALGARF